METFPLMLLKSTQSARIISSYRSSIPSEPVHFAAGEKQDLPRVGTLLSCAKNLSKEFLAVGTIADEGGDTVLGFMKRQKVGSPTVAVTGSSWFLSCALPRGDIDRAEVEQIGVRIVAVDFEDFRNKTATRTAFDVNHHVE